MALRAAAGIDHRRIRPIEAIGHFHAPILVLAGSEDTKTTSEESRALFARANPPKFYWEAPGAGHIGLAYAGGDAYQERLLGFLASTLGARNISRGDCGP